MKRAYVFDVDGTLTPSRQKVDQEFLDFLVNFSKNYDIYLVSGSDYPKTIEQLGEDFVTKCVQRTYSCSGNSVWANGHEIYHSTWRLPSVARDHLQSVLLSSKCPVKTGIHFEVRAGTVNFSTVGRGANAEQRQQYIEFDRQTNERQKIVDTFNTYFGSRLDCIAHIGGETGIDITQTGRDKQQILKDFADQPVLFYGDKCQPGGNDWPLAQAIESRGNPGDLVTQVESWRHTRALLTLAL
jgi:phosphomannomutase